MTLELNPYIFGRSLTPAEFLGRKKALRTIFGRLLTDQSTALIGAPHMGKTSLLNYIIDPDVYPSYVGQAEREMIFSYLDGQNLIDVHTQTQFWSRALNPIAQRLNNDRFEFIKRAYHIAEENDFGSFVLEQLFQEIHFAGYQLALILDEFDTFLVHPVLHSAEFYGSMRSLASRTPSLTLVLSSRMTLDELNIRTQDISPHGSPYFNVITEHHLGPLAHRTMDDLIRRGRSHFSRRDRKFIYDVSGRQPFLAQMSAGLLWDAGIDGIPEHKRYEITGENIYHQSRTHFADSWRYWPNMHKKALTAVALNQMPDLVSGVDFDVDHLTKNLGDYSPELEQLELSGIVHFDNETDKWEIAQLAFIWWLADELWKTIRDDTPFDDWLRMQTMEGIFSRQERDWMEKTAKSILGVLGKGATSFIQAYAAQLAG